MDSGNEMTPRPSRSSASSTLTTSSRTLWTTARTYFRSWTPARGRSGTRPRLRCRLAASCSTPAGWHSHTQGRDQRHNLGECVRRLWPGAVRRPDAERWQPGVEHNRHAYVSEATTLLKTNELPHLRVV